LATDTYDVVLDHNVVDRQIVEGVCADRCSVVQLATGMVPRAAEGFADENPLVERRAVVRTFSADGEPVRLDVNQEYRLSKRVTGNELTSTNTADRDALG